MLRRRFLALTAALACGPRGAIASSFGDNLVPVFFADGSAELDAEALKALAQVPSQYAASRFGAPPAPILVTGFVDANELGRGLGRLALARARAVADRLVEVGLPRERLRLETPSKPPVSADGAEPRNRAAHVAW